jgi:hypothetical protein
MELLNSLCGAAGKALDSLALLCSSRTLIHTHTIGGCIIIGASVSDLARQRSGHTAAQCRALLHFHAESSALFAALDDYFFNFFATK